VDSRRVNAHEDQIDPGKKVGPVIVISYVSGDAPCKWMLLRIEL
jgi:hypothetical protein